MFVNESMVREWQDFFRDIFNLLKNSGNVNLSDLLTSMAGGVYDTPVSYRAEIDELRRMIEAIPTPKSYDKDISDLARLMVSEAYRPQEDEMEDIYTSLGKNKTQKDLTFANDTGTVDLFAVTGDVFVNIIPVITTDVTSAATANIRLGVEGNTDAMIVDSVSTDLDARGIWVDQTPDNEIESTERMRGYIITDGNDVVLTLSAQVDAGAITFYCFWTPLSSDGLVEAA